MNSNGGSLATEAEQNYCSIYRHKPSIQQHFSHFRTLNCKVFFLWDISLDLDDQVLSAKFNTRTHKNRLLQKDLFSFDIANNVYSLVNLYYLKKKIFLQF